MKFLCDRCKTRYSIGDDRVRGKILKIRCKNCANVITVREGMADPDAMDAGAPAAAQPRRMKPTTMSPPVVNAAPAAPPVAAPAAPAGALGAAFASAMTRPPPALEEEWYVSIEGEQEGPYSLAEAQRWISSKAWDADLHCWSEGFDDWLPVDKVSHFRGLRKKPAVPPGPPPLPRATGAQPALRTSTGAQPALRTASTGPQARVEEEPKPLFAATMASLEKGAAAAAAASAANNGTAATSTSTSTSTGASAKLGIPSPAGNGTPPAGQARYPSPISGTPAIPKVTPSGPIPSIQARTNGTGPAAKLPTPTPLAPPPITTPAAAPAAKLGAKSGPVPRLEAKSAPSVENGDGATQIESPPFDVEAQTKAEPVASQAKASDAFGRSLANAPITADTDNDDDDGDLQIGEVSRVVNLADLAKKAPPKKATAANPALSRTGAVARLNATNSVPRVDVDHPSPLAAGLGVPGGTPALGEVPHEMAMQPSPPAESSHKKGMIILIGVATLLVAGVVVAVVLMGGGGDGIDQGLRRADTIDTTRPDDPLRPRIGDVTGPGAGSAATPVGPKPPIKRPVNTNGGNQVATNGSATSPQEMITGDALTPDDIDVVSKKYSTGTQRCYMRAQKGVDAITIGNVKSIQATLTVAKDGSVTDVALASHAENNLGKCLTTALKGWRFRPNPGGRIKFTLAFAQQ